MYNRITVVMLIILIVIGITGCSSTTSNPGEITVSAAASVSEVMEEIKDKFLEHNPNAEITYNYAASGVLRHQIEEGAPADLFISASVKYMDELEEKGLIKEGTRTDLLKNEIVLLIPIDGDPLTFEDLRQESVERITIGTPESAPVGRYAKEVLISLDLWDEIQPKIVFAKDVRQIVAYVESGNVEAGLSYRTDARISPDVKISAEASPQTHNPIIYPMGIIKDSASPELAAEFQNYLTGEEAAAIFKAYGFTHLSSTDQ